MAYKKLGILGGMGPMATSVFFERIVRKTKANTDQEHLDVVILNHATLPDRTKCIQTKAYDAFLSAIAPDFKTFEQLGVTHIAIPCNTSHFFYDAYVQMTDIPIIHMVEETVKVLIKQGLKGDAIGILATDGTVEAGVYEKALNAHGFQCVVPKKEEQAHVMRIIYALKSGNRIPLFEMEHLIQSLVSERKCARVILACTELSLLDLDMAIRPLCIDAMDVLVSEAILRGEKDLKDTI